MTPHTYEACFGLVMKFDGLRQDAAVGEKFATSYGVTAMTWAEAQRQGIVTYGIEHATLQDCQNILKVMYYNAASCGSLNPGVNLMVFNDAMVCGVGHAVKLLQRVVGAVPDGVVGPTTLRLANSVDVGDLIDDLRQADEEYYASLAKADLFLRGWTRREEFMAQQANLMAGVK